MGEVLPARTSPTLHPPSPPTVCVCQLSRLALSELRGEVPMELPFTQVLDKLHDSVRVGLPMQIHVFLHDLVYAFWQRFTDKDSVTKFPVQYDK